METLSVIIALISFLGLVYYTIRSLAGIYHIIAVKDDSVYEVPVTAPIFMHKLVSLLEKLADLSNRRISLFAKGKWQGVSVDASWTRHLFISGGGIVFRVALLTMLFDGTLLNLVGGLFV